MKQRKKLFLVLGSVLIGVAVATAVVLVRQSKQDGKGQVSDVCASGGMIDKVNEILPYMADTEQSRVQALADEIIATPGYDTSPTCLLVLTKHYFLIGDHVNARKYYDLLAASYNPEVGYGDSISTGPADSPEDLKIQVEGLEEVFKNMSENSRGFSFPDDGVGE